MRDEGKENPRKEKEQSREKRRERRKVKTEPSFWRARRRPYWTFLFLGRASRC